MKQNNSFNDIIPPGSIKKTTKRSIRDIPLSDKKQNKIDELLKETAEFRAEHQQHAQSVEEMPPRRVPSPVSRPSGSSRNFWIVSVLIILILAAGALFLFRSAEVTISLKTETVGVDLTIPAATETSQATGTLPYKVIPVQKQATKEVNATGAAVKVEKKASGTIIIYNNYNSSPQPLVATTRFETAEGLIYHLDNAVTVPGMSVVKGQNVPGSVEAVVTADIAGTKYNIDKTDFNVTGFKGTPKYEAFYARSKTAMTGGFSGTMPQVSAADLKAANDELRQTLTEQALAEVRTSKPASYVFFKDGVITSYSSEVTPAATGKATVTGKVTVEALIFEQAKVEEMIALNRSGEKYHFDNLDSLGFSIENKTAVTSFISEPVLSLKLTGTLTTGQSFDEDALKHALADKSKTQLQPILQMYPEITKAEAELHPFWSRSFPKDATKITIVVTKGE